MWRSILLVLLMATWAAAAGPADLRRKLDTEVGVAWGEYLRLASHVQGESSERWTDLKTGEVRAEAEHATFKLNGELGLSEHVRDGKRQMEFANERYECSASEISPGKWELREFGWKKPRGKQIRTWFSEADEGQETISHRLGKVPLAYASRGLIIQATWLPAMFIAPSFKIVDVRGAEDVGPGLVRVDFEYEPASIRNNSLRNGWVVLDPARYWQIRRAEVQLEEPDNVQGGHYIENEFDDTAVGFPYAARSVLRTHAASAERSVEYESLYTTRLKKVDVGNMAPFELATYGIAEPARPK